MNLRPYLDFATDLAYRAGRITLGYFNIGIRPDFKLDDSPVTAADRATEEFIRNEIEKKYPDHAILGEEFGSNNDQSAFRWIIDPIDGTTNYARRFPFFCVSIGFEVEGEVKLGAVYLPVLDELFHAEKGKGAYLNGERIRVSKVEDLSKSLVCTGFPYDVQERADFYLRYVREMITRSFALRRPGSAAIDLCYVAAGRFDGFWEWNLHAWDVAAASLIVAEAGGRLTDFRGGPFSIYGQQTLASNGIIHRAMIEAFAEIRD